MVVILVAGISGVGKSTLINAVRGEVDFKVLNFGDLIFEKAKEILKVNHRDELFHYSHLPIYKQLHKEVVKEIAKEKGNILLDTHLTLYNGVGFSPGTLKEDIELLNPVALVVVVAKPETIYERRRKDKSRKRPLISEELLREWQEAEKTAALTFLQHGVDVYFVENEDLSRAKQEFLNVLRLYFE